MLAARNVTQERFCGLRDTFFFALAFCYRELAWSGPAWCDQGGRLWMSMSLELSWRSERKLEGVNRTVEPMKDATIARREYEYEQERRLSCDTMTKATFVVVRYSASTFLGNVVITFVSSCAAFLDL